MHALMYNSNKSKGCRRVHAQQALAWEHLQVSAQVFSVTMPCLARDTKATNDMKHVTACRAEHGILADLYEAGGRAGGCVDAANCWQVGLQQSQPSCRSRHWQEHVAAFISCHAHLAHSTDTVELLPQARCHVSCVVKFQE